MQGLTDSETVADRERQGPSDSGFLYPEASSFKGPQGPHGDAGRGLCAHISPPRPGSTSPNAAPSPAPSWNLSLQYNRVLEFIKNQLNAFKLKSVFLNQTPIKKIEILTTFIDVERMTLLLEDAVENAVEVNLGIYNLMPENLFIPCSWCPACSKLCAQTKEGKRREELCLWTQLYICK